MPQPAELEHHPRLVDLRDEQLVGDLPLGLIRVVDRAAARAREERQRERVRPLARLPDRALRLVDEEQRDQHEQHRHRQRAGRLRVAALHQRLPDPPDPGQDDRGRHPRLADHVLVQARDRRPDRLQRPVVRPVRVACQQVQGRTPT
jgi:hypothetical protein